MASFAMSSLPLMFIESLPSRRMIMSLGPVAAEINQGLDLQSYAVALG